MSEKIQEIRLGQVYSNERSKIKIRDDFVVDENGHSHKRNKLHLQHRKLCENGLSVIRFARSLESFTANHL